MFVCSIGRGNFQWECIVALPFNPLLDQAKKGILISAIMYTTLAHGAVLPLQAKKVYPVEKYLLSLTNNHPASM